MRLSKTMRLAQWIGGLAMVAMVLQCAGVEGRSVAGMEDKPRDLFDQMVNTFAAKYLRLPAAPQLQWSVHPLPRKRQLNLAPSATSTSNDADDDDVAPSSLAGILGGGGGNAIPASVLAAAASPTGSATGSGSAAQQSASATGASSSDRSSPSAAPPSSSPSSASSSASTSATPLSKLITTSPSSTSSASSTSTSSTSTSTPPPSQSSPPLLSPKNKMFPLVVAGLAAAGLLALMLLIAIARCIAHDQLRRDKLAKSYSFDDSSPTKPDRFTSAPAGLGAARRSIKRAMTKKKLGSFARRTQDGSVLIEVGDEVFAVPAHLADSYREKLLREKRSQSDMGGLWGSVQPKHLNDIGPNGGDEEQARARYDDMLDGGGGVKRSLSQRLGDRLRSLTASATPATAEAGRPPMPERSAYSFATQHQPSGAMRQTDLASGKPTVTTGGAGWAIQQRKSSAQHAHPPKQTYGTAKVYERSTTAVAPRTSTQPAAKPQARKAPPKLELSLLTEKLADLEKQSTASSSASSKLPPEARLTASNSSCGTFGGSADSELSVPGAFPQRTKSLHRNKSVKPLILNPNVGTYRGRSPAAAQRANTLHPNGKRPKLERKPTSVALASPTRFAHDPRVVVHPQKPQPAATLRPLPVPPPFSLPK